MKRSKLVLFYNIGNPDQRKELDRHVLDGALWATKDELSDTVHISIDDFQSFSKEARSLRLQETRKTYPAARYVLIHMEKDTTGKVTYEVVEL